MGFSVLKLNIIARHMITLFMTRKLILNKFFLITRRHSAAIRAHTSLQSMYVISKSIRYKIH